MFNISEFKGILLTNIAKVKSEELEIDVCDDDLCCVENINIKQNYAFDLIMEKVPLSWWHWEDIFCIGLCLLRLDRKILLLWPQRHLELLLVYYLVDALRTQDSKFRSN